MKLQLKNALVLNQHFKFVNCNILIENERISTLAHDDIQSAESIDLTGHYIVPGFIDTHIHGAYGAEFSDEGCELDKATAFEATRGVTTIVPTILCMPVERTIAAIDKIVSIKSTSGAKIGGIHLEGPFVTQQFKGGLDGRYILPPDHQLLKEYINHGKGMIKLITLAPELEQIQSVIQCAVQNGITVSLGHSGATYDETMNAVEWGATQATHIFNAMRAFTHREPGILGALLTNDKIKCEMICDFMHLNPTAVKMVYKLKGADNINIISDSLAEAGYADGEYDNTGSKHIVKDGLVRLENGTICGSCKTMLDGVKNLVSAGICFEDVVRMACLNPAKTLGIDSDTGSIAVGKYADIVVLDKNLDAVYTFVNGKLVYSR